MQRTLLYNLFIIYILLLHSLKSYKAIIFIIDRRVFQNVESTSIERLIFLSSHKLQLNHELDFGRTLRFYKVKDIYKDFIK